MFSFIDCINEKKRPLVMGILNVTPDSFFEAGKSYFAEDAFNTALHLESAGADIIDIGGCATSPGKKQATLQEELARLKSVLPLIPNTVKVPVSVDTFRVKTAEYALNNGAVIVNDESGCFSEDMAKLVKFYNAGWVFMHTGNKTSSEEASYKNGVVYDVLEFFKEMKSKALAFGLKEEQLCFDYGLGFGKTREDDLTLLKNTSLFSEFRPLLVGVSNKRVIGKATGKDTNDRLYGTLSAESISVFLGAEIVRTHNVYAAHDAITVATSLKEGEFFNG